jgi:SAM-dependent methyltransferase
MSTTTTDPIAALKDIHRATWAAGDYASVAEHIDDVPPTHLLAAVGINPGDEVLDVATGTGNVALKAARTAKVTGLDLVPELLDVARDRADRAGVELELVVGDAEDLPFAGASFDKVLSVFGIQFAPRHALVAAELVRVCRPGGSIGLVNWTPEGLIGRMFKIMGKYLPAPPDFASPPPKWGDEEHVRELFAPYGLELSFERGMNTWSFPSVESYQTFFEERYGPTLKAQERLTAEGTWEQCRAELRELYESMNEATDGTLRIDAEYLVVVGRR